MKSHVSGKKKQAQMSETPAAKRQRERQERNARIIANKNARAAQQPAAPRAAVHYCYNPNFNAHSDHSSKSEAKGDRY